MWCFIYLVVLCKTMTLVIAGGDGYHYPAPFLIKPADTGHYFPAVSTVSPLPAVPDLPPLPTPRSNVHSQVQVHQAPKPSPSRVPFFGPSFLLHATPAPLPVVSSVSRFTQGYLPAHGQRTAFSHPAANTQTTGTDFNYFTPRVDEDFYSVNGRQLKQYAVFEIIDNDLEVPAKPFLTNDFFNPMRARLGGSGIGATAFSGDPENQFQGRVNALLLEQQRISQQLQPRAAAGDTINIGSGGLGYIRLPNGNVYLGSGSLGYISGQEHSQSVLEARTRSESTGADALHFGHGPLFRNSNSVRFQQ